MLASLDRRLGPDHTARIGYGGYRRRSFAARPCLAAFPLSFVEERSARSPQNANCQIGPGGDEGGGSLPHAEIRTDETRPLRNAVPESRHGDIGIRASINPLHPGQIPEAQDNQPVIHPYLEAVYRASRSRAVGIQFDLLCDGFGSQNTDFPALPYRSNELREACPSTAKPCRA